MFNNFRRKCDKGKIKVRLIVAMLVLALTFSNFALLGLYLGKAITSYAAGENITFEAYIVDESNQRLEEPKVDINSTELKLHLSVSVGNEGSLSNAKIMIENSNFKLQNTSLPYIIDSLPANQKKEIKIPIVVRKDNPYNLNLLNMESQIKLTGEYTDSATNNVETINSTQNVKVNWTTDSITDEDIELNQEIITNKIYEINGANKRVIQMLVTSKVKDNKAPVKSSVIKISNPELVPNAVPERVKVVGYSTKATNGKTSVEFDDTNWSYDATSNQIKITVDNSANAQNEVSWEKSCQDRFVVTYMYDEGTVVSPFICDAKATVKLYGRTEDDTVEKNNELNLETLNNFGVISTLENITTSELYKGNMYIGQDTEFETRANIYVPYSNIVDKMIVEDLGDKAYKKNNEEQLIELPEVITTCYKATKINAKEALKVLGENGTIKVYNAENTTTPIGEITVTSDYAEDYYNITYGEAVNKIKIETSKAVQEGMIEVVNTKSIKVLETVEESLKQLAVLKTNLRLKVLDANSTEIVKYNIPANMNLLEPETTFDIILDKDSLSTQIENDLKVTIELKSDDIKYKLFDNPIIKIELPKEIKEVSLENITDVFYDNELSMKSNEIVTNKNGNKELILELQGTQSTYNYNTSSQNATVEADLKVKIEPFMPDKNVEIKATCFNNGEENNPITVTNNVRILSGQGLITKNALRIGTDVKEEVNNNDLSISAVENTIVNISSSIINNYAEDILNINIVGNIPEGTTLNGAVTCDTTGTAISYSTESNPTLNSTSWQTEVTDFSEIKSFKLTLSKLGTGALLEIKYDLNVNLDSIQENALVNPLTISFDINGQPKQKIVKFTINVEKQPGQEEPGTQVEKFNSKRRMRNPGQEEPGPKAEITIAPKMAKGNVLHENQIITYEIKVTNTSTETLKNLTLNYLVPEGAKITNLTDAQGTETTFTDEDILNKEWQIENLNTGETIVKEVTIKIAQGTTQIVNSAKLISRRSLSS